MVTVGIEGSRITAVAAGHGGAGAGRGHGRPGDAAPWPRPPPTRTWFVPVVEITQARYNQLKPVIYPVPGTVFQTSSARTAVTPGLAAHVVGSVGPVTAQETPVAGAALPGR